MVDMDGLVKYPISASSFIFPRYDDISTHNHKVSTSLILNKRYATNLSS